MGHLKDPHAIEPCKRKCAHSNTPTAVVLTVRDPYDYWVSCYKYAYEYACGPNEIMSGEAIFLHANHRACLGGGAKGQGVLKSFENFMEYVGSPAFVHDGGTTGHGGWTLTSRIRHACGQPCKFDFLLHTETLTRDWERMLRHFNLPHVALQHDNDSGASDGSLWGAAPRAVYTAKTRRVVNALEAEIFDEFGYKMRTE